MFKDSQPLPMTRNRYTADNSPSTQPPEVPARSAVPALKQNQASIRTVSAPESPVAAEHRFGVNTGSVKNQEVKPTIVTNLKILKNKFQKKPSMSQEFMYTEINMEATDKSRNTENEYQEITGEQTFTRPHFPCTDVTDGGLPQEYFPPPPFAPGYWYTTVPLENNALMDWSVDCGLKHNWIEAKKVNSVHIQPQVVAGEGL